MNVIHIALADLKLVAKDKRAAIWLLAMPLVFAFIFGSALRGGGPQATWIPVIDLDHSELSQLFIEQLREDGYWIETKNAQDQRELKQKWPYGIVIPADFSSLILTGKPVQLTVVKGNGSAERVLDLQSRLAQVIIRFTKGLAIADTSHQTWNSASRDRLKDILSRPQLLTVDRKSDPSLRPPPSGFYMSLPGILMMFVLQMILIYGGTTLVADRVKGRLGRLFATPVFPFEVYCGKMLARVLIALLQSTLILVGGAWLFGIQFGDHGGYLAPVLLCYAVFAGSLGLLGGLICRTEKQVVQLAIFAAMFLAALGCNWWSIELVPDVFKTIAHFTPTYWGMHGIQNVMYFNKSYHVLLRECPILLAFAVVCLSIAVYYAKRISPGRN